MIQSKRAQFEIETDVFFSPAFWILLIMAEVAMWIGFFGSSALGLGSAVGYPIWMKIFLTLAIPLIVYVIVLKMS